EENIAAAALAEGGKLQLERAGLGGDADIDWRETLLPQLAGNEFFVVARQAAGADLSIRCNRPEEESGHQNSCVTRMTSSTVVTPPRILLQPSSRRLRIPLRRAALVSTPASWPVMISLRISSLTSIISKMPTREV